MVVHNMQEYSQANQVANLTEKVFDVAAPPDWIHEVAERPTRTRLIRGLPQVCERKGLPHVVPCHPGYRTADPYEISKKLEEAGLKVSRLHWNRAGNKALIEATFPGSTEESDGAYKDCVKFLLDHAGRSAILIQPGALRCACDNQFYAPAIRIPHIGEDANAFVLDPAKFAFDARYLAGQARERLNGLRGKGDGSHLITEGLSSWRRLQCRAFKAACDYTETGAWTAWTALQGMTATKSPRLVDLACKALGEGYDEVLEGKVPTSWAP